MTVRIDPRTREEAIEYVASTMFDNLTVAAGGLAAWLRGHDGEGVSEEEARTLLIEKLSEKNDALKPANSELSR